MRPPVPLVALLAAILFAVPSKGTIYLVCPDGSGDFNTIQEAADASSDGDAIELCDGIFTGDGNRDIDYRGKRITLRSLGWDPVACIIDCSDGSGAPHRGFRFVSGEDPTAVLEGVTVRRADVTSILENGGGILCSGSSSPTINRCVFLENDAYFGAGVHCEDRW